MKVVNYAVAFAKGEKVKTYFGDGTITRNDEDGAYVDIGGEDGVSEKYFFFDELAEHNDVMSSRDWLRKVPFKIIETIFNTTIPVNGNDAEYEPMQLKLEELETEWDGYTEEKRMEIIAQYPNAEVSVLKELSGNDLSELQCLMGDIGRLIGRTYSHVSGHMPSDLQDAITAFTRQVTAERYRREDER